MSDTPPTSNALDDPPIAYASATALLATESSADRLLRRVVAAIAIWEGGVAIIGQIVALALAKGWLASPSSMSWEFKGLENYITSAIGLMLSATLVTGGLLLLRRRRVAIVLLRVSAIATIAMSLFGFAMSFYKSPIWASYWSTFGAATIQTIDMLRGFVPPTLLILLTWPPLARRMV